MLHTGCLYVKEGETLDGCGRDSVPRPASGVREVLRRRDGVLIELALRGTLGGRAVMWTAVDRIILRNGMIVERRSYFDPLPLFGARLSRPAASLRLLAMMVSRKEIR